MREGIKTSPASELKLLMTLGFLQLWRSLAKLGGAAPGVVLLIPLLPAVRSCASPSLSIPGTLRCFSAVAMCGARWIRKGLPPGATDDSVAEAAADGGVS